MLGHPWSVWRSTAGVGAICAWALAVLQALASLVYLLLPAALRVGVPGATVLPAYHHDPGLLPLEFTLLALVGVVGIGVVPAVSAQTESLPMAGSAGWQPWPRWATPSPPRDTSSRSRASPRSPMPMSQGILLPRPPCWPLGAVRLDPQGFWQFAAVGVWIIVVSVLALQRKQTLLLAYLGLVVGVLYCLTPIGVIQANSSLLNGLVATVGVVLATIWYAWMGLELWRLAQKGGSSVR